MNAVDNHSRHAALACLRRRIALAFAIQIFAIAFLAIILQGAWMNRAQYVLMGREYRRQPQQANGRAAANLHRNSYFLAVFQRSPSREPSSAILRAGFAARSWRLRADRFSRMPELHITRIASFCSIARSTVFTAAVTRKLLFNLQLHPFIANFRDVADHAGW